MNKWQNLCIYKHLIDKLIKGEIQINMKPDINKKRFNFKYKSA